MTVPHPCWCPPPCAVPVLPAFPRQPLETAFSSQTCVPLPLPPPVRRLPPQPGAEPPFQAMTIINGSLLFSPFIPRICKPSASLPPPGSRLAQPRPPPWVFEAGENDLSGILLRKCHFLGVTSADLLCLLPAQAALPRHVGAELCSCRAGLGKREMMRWCRMMR